MRTGFRTTRIVWNMTVIQIKYDPDWLNGHGPARLMIESIVPEGTPLPITETGFRAHYVDRESIEEAGGPGRYVKAWLEDESQTPAWKAGEWRRRQYHLF